MRVRRRRMYEVGAGGWVGASEHCGVTESESNKDALTARNARQIIEIIIRP